MTMLSDEELAGWIDEIDFLASPNTTLSTEATQNAIRAHIAALSAEVSDRDGAIERITEDLNDAHRERLRDHEQAATVQAELLARIGELTAQRDRARDIAVSLEQELAEVQAVPQRWLIGGPSEQQAIEECPWCIEANGNQDES